VSKNRLGIDTESNNFRVQKEKEYLVLKYKL
jgi:hypothetical protein